MTDFFFFFLLKVLLNTVYRVKETKIELCEAEGQSSVSERCPEFPYMRKKLNSHHWKSWYI
jgi:hypothetical protein